MRSGRRACGVVAVAALLVLSPVAVPAAAVRSRAPLAVEPVERCRITDDRLVELSGLVSSTRAWFAVTDGGESLDVFVLDPEDCSVRDVITGSVDPYDVEDLEIDDRGRLWLADVGDNSLRRDTVAIHVVGTSRESQLYRLRYPDGPHDAETMLLGPAGIPHIVTKEPFGRAGIYRPAHPLEAGGTVALERVGSVSVPATDTPGGPLPGALGSVVFTGGAVSHDGSVIALRTYTDAYLYAVPRGSPEPSPSAAGSDLVAALRSEPVRIPLPRQPQGEAIAFEPDGTLLAASEGREPVRVFPGAVREFTATMRPATVPPESAADAHGRRPAARSGSPPSDGAPTAVVALLITAVLAGAVALVGVAFSRRR